ncbi:hypothetical protein BDN67DRAFT_814902 [Paxillus ammoniavirescens]|nr:hypothetical protein BDN67DRAFT_814902 [Paxillus ammoniavirescens]
MNQRTSTQSLCLDSQPPNPAYGLCSRRQYHGYKAPRGEEYPPTSQALFKMVTSYPKYQPTQDHAPALARAPLRQPRVDHHSGILQALTDSAHDLLAENALYKEIETLSKATLTIDKAFYDIGQKLSQATKEQNKRIELYKTCHDLETRWKQHHEVGFQS